MKEIRIWMLLSMLHYSSKSKRDVIFTQPDVFGGRLGYSACFCLQFTQKFLPAA
ncbi:hypothetical protein [uncultured Acinetobacter sp.]|uniref:hypothetical protein n=1 Tax=uncultured Acinetobacter sp. TaxID=165433 RepID=UPI00261DF3DD|nr:hypothetical protein [uncultured Acinetobacter sp.]